MHRADILMLGKTVAVRRTLAAEIQIHALLGCWDCSLRDPELASPVTGKTPSLIEGLHDSTSGQGG